MKLSVGGTPVLALGDWELYYDPTDDTHRLEMVILNLFGAES